MYDCKKTRLLYFRTQRENSFAAFESDEDHSKMAAYPKQTLVAKRMPQPGAVPL